MWHFCFRNFQKYFSASRLALQVLTTVAIRKKCDDFRVTLLFLLQKLSEIVRNFQKSHCSRLALQRLFRFSPSVFLLQKLAEWFRMVFGGCSYSATPSLNSIPSASRMLLTYSLKAVSSTFARLSSSSLILALCCSWRFGN